MLRILFNWFRNSASDPILKSEWCADDYSKEAMKLNARFALKRFPREQVILLYGEEFVRKAEEAIELKSV